MLLPFQGEIFGCNLSQGVALPFIHIFDDFKKLAF